MNAVQVRAFGEPDVLKLEQVPDPTPGPGQIVVRVRAAGVNPVEAYVRKGTYGPREFPFTPGSDAAGEVDSVGPGVTGHRVGDRVYVYVFGTPAGTYAERVVADAGRAYPLPDRLSFAQGAAVGVPYGTAYRALFVRGRAAAGETVLVHGASGGVGTAAVQLARDAGLTVIATAGTDAGKRLAREQGAAHVVDHHAADHVQQVLNLTPGKRGVDLIIELAAHANLGKDLTMLAKFGRVVVVGSRGPVEVNPRDTMARDADVLGMVLPNADEPELARIHAALGAGLSNGSLTPVVGKQFPLADAPRAHEAVMANGSYGKIVLVP